MVDSEAATPSEREDTPVEPEPPPEPIKPIVEAPTPEDTPEIETLPEVPTASVVIAQAAPPPREDKPKQEKPKPQKQKPKQAKKDQRKKQDRTSPNAPTTAAPKAAPVPRASVNAAPNAGASSSTSPANWRSALMAHLNRHKRFPPGGGRGTASVAFSIDRAGRVLSARLVRSSGDATLDQEAVALARRASPVPPPPPNVGNGGNVLLAVPIRLGITSSPA